MTDVGAPAPEVYRLSMEKLPAAVGRARRFAFVVALGGITALVALIEAVFPGSPAAADVSLGVWALGALLIPYALWKVRLRVRRRWNAFELSIGPTNMRCAARGSGRVTIALDEITSITEGASGIVVLAASSGASIRVPQFVEGFVDVRARLERRRPIAASADAGVWCAALAGAGVLAAVTVPLWGGAGSVAVGVLASQVAAAFAASVEIRRHPRLPRARRLLGLALVAVAAMLPIVALAARELVLATR